MGRLARAGPWISNSLPGGHSEREPPDPIPNSEVKTLSADGSVVLRPCQSRSLPGSRIVDCAPWALRKAPAGKPAGAFALSSRAESSAALTQYIAVQLKSVCLERGGRIVLREIDWSIRPGERWVLIGGNGAGKTQLLKLLAGDVWPTPTGREQRHYFWRGEIRPTPYEVKDEIAYVGAERQD